MSQPRNHHTVPKAYLKYFTDLNGKINVYDKQTQQYFKSYIKNIAANRDFYRDILIENEFYWESFYAKTVEPLIPLTFDMLIMSSLIITNTNKILNSELRVKLSYIIFTQLMRSKKSWDTWLKTAANLGDNDLPLNIKSKIDDLLKLGKSEAEAFDLINKSYLLQILNSKDLILSNIETLLNMNWIVLKNNNTSKGFYTSDNPVTFFHIDSKSCNFIEYGPLYKGCIIMFPINYDLCLMLIPLEHVDTQNLTQYNNCILDTSTDLIDACNQIQNEQCYRQVYYKPQLVD